MKQSGQQKKDENEKRKVRRNAKIDETRLQGRIDYWKNQQKNLAIQKYKNELDKAYNSYLHTLLPTSALPHLLDKMKSF